MTIQKKDTANKLLIPSAGISAALLLAVIYTPSQRPLFNTTALGLRDWLTLMLSTGGIGRIDRLFETDGPAGSSELTELDPPNQLPVPVNETRSQQITITAG